METHTPVTKTEYSMSESYNRHKKQRFWQIGAPLGIGILLMMVILGLVIFDVVGNGPDSGVDQWANASLIWLFTPLVLIMLLSLAALIGLIYLISRLMKVLPGYTYTAQYYVDLGAAFVKSYANKLISPIVSIKSFGAAIENVFQGISGGREK